MIGDLSGQHDPAYTPLNGTALSKNALRDTIAAQWGEIKHPTVIQLVLMVLTAADIHGWNNLVLWKKDLKGAFNLLNYNPASCKLFAFPLSDGLTMIHLAGLFGWIGMPHAFQVLTRSLQALCSHIILGLCYWYVDDLMAVSLFPVTSLIQQGLITQCSTCSGKALLPSINRNALDNLSSWVGYLTWITGLLLSVTETCTSSSTPCSAST